MEVLHLSVHPAGFDEAPLVAYLPDSLNGETRPAAIICPGGGYAFVSPREGEPVALDFVARGMACFVLDYAIAPVRYPAALRQLAEAIALVRQHAKAWHITPDRVLVAGFSAGGHLAASLATLYADPILTEAGYDPAVSRPDGLMLGYPVITGGPKAHRGSFDNLLGPDAAAAQIKALSLETRVTAQTPPTFLWSTADDGAVPIANTLMFADALAAHDVPFALHIFPHGHHGLSLATAAVNDEPEPTVAVWPELFGTWVHESW
ncbi:alpha/beta hydrolase [Lacticaseibacillus jixiensis]|uniref:alpha/beta hydrolase n=1 Tax=Lacticaseibacillus jixiensis TaxID=3231926 RepID=UPI0036F3D4F7